MRSDTSTFAAANTADAKSPRFVVKIEYASISLYLSSHSDITGIPATHIAGCLIEPSITSQKLNPDQGRAEIGAASFSAVDVNTELSDNIRALNAAGEGLRGKTCRFYLGYQGLAWSDFVLVGTQIISDASFDKGAYKIACNDIQRATRKDIFSLATTTIASTVEAADTTINVVTTTGFSTVVHGAAYSDSPSATVGYLKIKDEVVKYTGKTATSFTGCTRGALGTQAARYVADGSTPASRREKVTEYVYLEMTGPKLAYALLTGTLYNDSATLPSTWHLGISSSLVRQADFTGIGKDLWDTTNDAAGVVLRFEGLSKTDGKAFIETEILRLLGLYMPVYATGELGLRRMTRVLADAAGVVTLDESNSVSVGELQHDMDSLHNSFLIDWNWNGKDYTRTTVFLDAASVAKHGRADDLELKFKGLYGGRHTDGLILKVLDQIRDRYAAPPLRHKREVFHSLNTIEVGDVVKVHDASVRDFTGADDTIDRAFEVQSVSVNHLTGAVSLDLFGSTGSSSITSPTTPTTALPDAFYTASGTNLASVWTISGGTVSGGPYTLTGGTDLTASGSIWYYSGDLVIPVGVTVNISGNVQIRVKGSLTINGTINGVGGGLAGVADDATATSKLTGNPGFVGNARGRDGCTVNYLGDTNVHLHTRQPAVTVGKNAAFPYVALEVSGSTLKGLPTDLRGTGGGPGGKVVEYPTTQRAAGGTGGAGGAGLCTVSRGFGLGASASINLSGANTSAPSAYHYSSSPAFDIYPGAGASGGPGAYLLLLDGGLLSAPDLSGRFQARNGTSGVPTVTNALTDTAGAAFRRKAGPFAGWLDNPDTISGLDLSFSAQRIQYIPAPETPVADTSTLAPVESVTVTNGSSGYTVSFTPGAGTPQGTVFEIWEYTASTPFASATKRAEGAATSIFVSRGDTTTVYCWVRARYTNSVGVVTYSTTTPATTGIAAAAAAVAGTYATASPTSLTASAASGSITTASCTASLVGATATTYSWARQSGSTSISVNSASSATTTFSATAVSAGATVSAVFRCTINSTYTIDVPVDCTNTSAALNVSASPSSLTKNGTSSSLTTDSTTATATGGAGGYSYAWTKVSGGSISADSASAATTTFTATGLSSGESRSATFRVTATDAAAVTATYDISVTISYVVLSVSLSPTELKKTASTSAITTASCTATGSGGTSPYTYAWTKVSGASITCDSPASATTTFSATGMGSGETRVATYRVTATDAASLTATADIVVTIKRITL